MPTETGWDNAETDRSVKFGSTESHEDVGIEHGDAARVEPARGSTRVIGPARGRVRSNTRGPLAIVTSM